MLWRKFFAEPTYLCITLQRRADIAEISWIVILCHSVRLVWAFLRSAPINKFIICEVEKRGKSFACNFDRKVGKFRVIYARRDNTQAPIYRSSTPSAISNSPAKQQLCKNNCHGSVCAGGVRSATCASEWAKSNADGNGTSAYTQEGGKRIRTLVIAYNRKVYYHWLS